MRERLLYPDICKFVAIFIVTCSHCAQYISGETWTNFFLGTHLDIAFNMPLFMLISGWFINLDKMRETKALVFFWSKFQRLMIPAFVWYVLMFLLARPQTSPLSFYWYLTALFVCMCIIYVFAKVFKNNVLCMSLSTLFVLACPITDFVHINFMFPYLWGGVILNKIYNSKYDKWFFWTCLIIGVVLSFYWKTDYTVYRTPLDVLHINIQMIVIYLYRFIIGLTLSSAIIYLIKSSESILAPLAKYGQYSLPVYTGSFVINSAVAILLVHLNYHTNQMLLIDIVSISLCCVIYFIIVIFSNLSRRNTVTKLLFLGE